LVHFLNSKAQDFYTQEPRVLAHFLAFLFFRAKKKIDLPAMLRDRQQRRGAANKIPLIGLAPLREQKKMSPRPPRRTGQAVKKVSRENQDSFAAWRLCACLPQAGLCVNKKKNVSQRRRAAKIKTPLLLCAFA
jgi:hypothetical protein